jgi:ADP-heptose:LPS heptosyltransferase
VYQIGSLGDTLVSIPSYRAIRRKFGKDAEIIVLHNEPSDRRASAYSVLAGSELVDGHIGFKQNEGRSTWKTLLSLWPRIATGAYSAAVYLAPGERSISAVNRDRFFFRSCGISNLYGFHATEPGIFQAKDSAGRPATVPHEAVMRQARLTKDGIPNNEADMIPPFMRPHESEILAAQAWIQDCGPVRAGIRYAAICPGSNQPAKLWPKDRFIEVGRRLVADGDYMPIVIGGPAEKELGDEFLAAWGEGLNAAGIFSVRESAALLSQCDFLVGLDTGTTHLAASVGVPCVALYADRDPAGQWTPLGTGHTILRHQVDCAGCGAVICPKPGHPCMSNITLEQVWDAILKTAHRASDLRTVGLKVRR